MNEKIIAKKVIASLSEDKIEAFNFYLKENSISKDQNLDFHDDISFDESNNIAKIFNKEYYILTDDEANDMCYEYIKNLVDDAGITAIKGYEHFINEHYFDYMQQEYAEGYCWDIKDEEDDKFGTRLVQECYEKGLIDDNDFEENEEGEIDYKQCKFDEQELIDKYVEDACEENSFDYITNGEEYLINDLIKHYDNCVDWQGLTDYVISNDGRGSIISSYDGYEDWVEYNGEDYYIYRID